MQPLNIIDDTSAITIRYANKSDTVVLLKLIRELAEYEKLSGQVVATEEDLAQTLFGSRPYAEVLLAEDKDQTVGFCLFFYNYSTLSWQARDLYRRYFCPRRSTR